MIAPVVSIALLVGLWNGTFALLLAIGLAVSVGIATKRRVTLPVPVTVLCLVAMALALGAGRAAMVPDPPHIPWADSADRFEGVIVSTPRTDSTWQRFELKVNRVRVENTWQDADVVIAVTAPRYPDLGYGDAIGMIGTVDPNDDLPRGYAHYLESRGVSGAAFSYAVWVEERGTGIRRMLFDIADRMVLQLRTAVPGDSGVFLAGLVTGDDTALSDSRETRFIRTGTSHLTAVSGANVAIIVVLLVSAGSMVGWRRSPVVQLGILSLVWAYAAMTGLETPVVRAALIVTIAVLANRLGRRTDYLGAALISAAIIAFIDPRDLHSVAFGLSFAASLGLAAVFKGTLTQGVSATFMTALAATTVAQLATLPVTLATFGTIPLASVPANALIGPVVSVAFPLALAAAIVGLVWPTGGEALAVAAGWFADLVLVIVDILGGVGWLLIAIPPITPAATVVVALVSGIALALISRDSLRWLGRIGQTPPGRKPLSKWETASAPKSEKKPTLVP